MQAHSYSAPPSFTSRFARKARAKGMYHYGRAVDEYLPNDFVRCGNQTLLMMAGYSYLGFIRDRAILEEASRAFDKYGLGAYGARISCGTVAVHAELEARLAQVTRSEDCVLFSSGFQANAATIPALFTPRDTIFSDQLNHASILDGIQASGARAVTYRHNDMRDLEAKLAQRGDGNALIVSDAVFSMDGDIADIPALIDIKSRYGALLMIDEAHSLGVLGRNGFGATQHFDTQPGAIDLVMGVLSKGIPGTGGYVCGSTELIDYLRHNARGYLFSGAMAPFQAAVAIACLNRLEQATDRIERLNANTAYFHNQLRDHGLDIGATSTPITPVLIGDSDVALRAADHCIKSDVFLNGVVFPIVPFGKARLRATVTADHQMADLADAANAIAAAMAAVRGSKLNAAELASI